MLCYFLQLWTGFSVDFPTFYMNSALWWFMHDAVNSAEETGVQQ